MKYLIVCLLVVATFADYSVKDGADLAQFSRIAYSLLPVLSLWKCIHCSKFEMTDIKAFNNITMGMQGYVGYSTQHSAIIVALRGSSNIRNWIADFAAFPVKYPACPGCIVHQGFSLGYNTVAGSIRTQVKAILAKHQNAPIYVTGHSLGGALAVLAALDLHSLHSNPVKLYTYGQPRVGNAAFASYTSSQIPDAFRVIHYADIVPHVPPSKLNFTHHSHEVWYQKGMKSYKVCVAEDPTCSESIKEILLNVIDHDFNAYAKIQTVSHLRKFLDDIQDPSHLF